MKKSKLQKSKDTKSCVDCYYFLHGLQNTRSTVENYYYCYVKEFVFVETDKFLLKMQPSCEYFRDIKDARKV